MIKANIENRDYACFRERELLRLNAPGYAHLRVADVLRGSRQAIEARRHFQRWNLACQGKTASGGRFASAVRL